MMTASTLALALALVPTQAQADGVTIKWVLKEGDLFYAKSTQVMDMTIGVMGQNIDQKQESNTVVRFKVKSVKPGATVVEMTTVEFKLDAGAGVPGIGGIAEKMKGMTFTATLDDKMQVTKLEGYDKFLDTISDGDDNMKKLLKSILPQDTFKQMFSQTFAIAPEKPVSVGDTWKQSDKMPLGPLGEFTMKQSFKLESVTDGLAKIGLKAEMEFKPGGGGDGGLPFKITKGDIKSDKFTGTHTFDVKAGRLKESTTDAVMSGSLTAAAGGQEIEITLKMKIKQKTEVTEKNPVRD